MTARLIVPADVPTLPSTQISGLGALATQNMVSCTELPALTGAITSTSGSCVTTASSIPYTALSGAVTIWNQNTTGNAATATALAASPAQCTGVQYATGVTAAGAANCAAVAANQVTGPPVIHVSTTPYAPTCATINGTIVEFDTGSSAFTLPVTTASGCGNGFGFDTQVKTSSTITITPTTSTINGAATLAMATGTGVSVGTDSTGSNYAIYSCTACATVINLASPGPIGGTTPSTISTTALTTTATAPVDYLQQTGAGTNLGWWQLGVTSGVLTLGTSLDSGASGLSAMAITRGTTTNISTIAFGNTTSNPTYSFLGSGNLTMGTGNISVSSTNNVGSGAFIPSGSGCVSGSRLYLPAANTIGLCANATAAASFTSTIDTMLGTTFTATNATTVSFPALPTSSAAQTGTVCSGAGGVLSVDTTTTCLLSDGRHKMNVEPLDGGIGEIMQLRPVSYDLKPDVNPTHLGRQVGLIAQDVMDIDPRLASVYQAGPDKGTPSGVRYEQMVALLVTGMQEQQREIKSLQRQLRRRHP